jgi:hypothetical protein
MQFKAMVSATIHFAIKKKKILISTAKFGRTEKNFYKYNEIFFSEMSKVNSHDIKNFTQ